ncbi:MAG TPA: glycosyltransferase [Bacteroidia bacterium]|nr:glycosyltransferase [Bacteroidia bacterium]
MFSNKTIFIAPLDWGLGHATRCVPIIKELLKHNSVILGITPLTKPIFEEEFPGVKMIEIPAYNITYSKHLPLWLKLGISYPKISKIIANENKLLEKIINDYKIDVVISDNRFGLHSKNAHCVFITHQLFLKAPVFENFAQKQNKKYILNFDEVWVPDYETSDASTSSASVKNLSGELSHGTHFHKNVKYIGPQSRLTDVICEVEKNKYEYLILLSGPEPGRTTLENELLLKAKNSTKKIALVRGSQFKVHNSGFNGIDAFDFPKKEELKKLILSSDKIICRSGYSTLMDMHLLDKKELILIPTHGQSEQEYLAEYWQQHFNSKMILEKNLTQFTL